MAHPFAKMLEKALKESTPLDNRVLGKAEELVEKGYSGKEVAQVLRQLRFGRIDDDETEIIDEALEEFADHLEE